MAEVRHSTMEEIEAERRCGMREKGMVFLRVFGVNDSRDRFGWKTKAVDMRKRTFVNMARCSWFAIGETVQNGFAEVSIGGGISGCAAVDELADVCARLGVEWRAGG